jgi:hypothetical protein
MSEANQNAPVPQAWATLYHPLGCPVSVPLADEEWTYDGFFKNVTNAIAAGFLVDQPESRKAQDAKAAEVLGKTRPQQEIGGILLMEVKGKYGKSHRAFFYSVNPAMKHKVADIYVNTKDDRAAFLQHTGIDLDDRNTPIFEGTAAPERGKSDRADAKIIKIDPPIWITIGPNPKYSEDDEKRIRGWDEGKQEYTKKDEVYKVSKRAFAHWGGGEGQKSYAEWQASGDGQHAGDTGEPLTAYDVALQKIDACNTLADVDAANAYIKSQWAKIDKASQDDLRQRRDDKLARIKANEDVPF